MRKLETWRRALAFVFVFSMPAAYKVFGVVDAMNDNGASFTYGIIAVFATIALAVSAILGEVPDDAP